MKPADRGLVIPTFAGADTDRALNSDGLTGLRGL